MKDTLDGKLDMSNMLINMNGFMPVPIILSEPALGNFGVALAAIFISPQKDTSNKDRFHFPTMNVGLGMYTLNNSWAAGFMRMGSIPKWGMRYRVAAFYGDINMNFYRTTPIIGEHEYEINNKVAGFLVEGSKSIYRNRVFLGVNYKFFNTHYTYDLNNLLPIESKELELKSNNGTLGFFLDVDYRDNTFTPNKGVRFKPSINLHQPYTASDFEYNKYSALLTAFHYVTPKWNRGWKAEFMGISKNSPFFAYPFISMRGLPMMRYQGQQTILFETEQRFDITYRWSLVGFVGTGRAFGGGDIKTDENWQVAGGAGFRYLIARIFNIRTGIDIAKGP
ncbi:MAG: glyceraldehyde-3-phosphate dehydrogenase [Cytophagaceae bacterium]